MKEHYTIDLRTSILDVRTYSVDLIKADLSLFGLKRPMDLDLSDTFNTKIFATEKAADAWREKYIRTRDEMKRSSKFKAVKGAPKMLCKQRYIVLSQLGEKTFTRRSYRKNWKVGTDFQLYDQTIFLTVRLTRITDTLDGSFTYEYKLI